MMYNRYIPQPDGSYRRSRAGEPDRPQPRPPKPEPQKQPPCTPPAPPPPQKKQKSDCSANRPQRSSRETGVDSFLRQLLPKDFDTGDLLVVILLLLMAGDCAEDRNNAILTMALYFLM